MKLFSRFKLGQAEKSGLISAAIKPISMILGILYTPLLLRYLGDEQYGVWAIILSVISWVNYCDIGIGNGLRNLLTQYLTGKNYEKAKRAVSTAYICLSIISGIIFIILLFSVIVLDWKKIFNTQYDVNIPLLISFVFICVNFILSLCNTLLYSLQKAEIVSVQSVIVQMINIFILFILNRFTDGSLVNMSILFGFSTLITYSSTSFILFKKYSYLKPSTNNFDKYMVKTINQLGIKFFIAQITFVVLYTTDNLLVSRLFGAAQVTPFSIVDRVFSTGYSLFTAFLTPYWSKTTLELAKRNYKGIRRYFRNLNFFALFFCAGCIVVSFIIKPIINIWLGKDLDISNNLIIVMCVYYCIYSFCAVSSPMLNGLSAVNGVMILGIFQGIVNIPLSIYLATDGGFGIMGIRLGTLIPVAIGAVYQFIYFYLTLQKYEKNDKELNR